MMRKLICIVIASLMFSSLSFGVQPKGFRFVESKSKTKSESFSVFWTNFKAALAKNDKKAITSMTKLPFPFKYDEVFTPGVRRCFAKAKPIRDGDSYEVFCADTIYLFELVGGVYKFTDMSPDD